jgi:hypothetical protein
MMGWLVGRRGGVEDEVKGGGKVKEGLLMGDLTPAFCMRGNPIR